MVENKYKDNPLEHLEAWLYESINSNAIPKDVYAVLVNTIEEQVNYHQEGLEKAQQLLSLVRGKESKVVKDVTYSSSDWQDFWEGRTPDDEFEGKLKDYGYEYAPTSSANIKLNAITPYNDGWTQQHYQQKIPSRY